MESIHNLFDFHNVMHFSVKRKKCRFYPQELLDHEKCVLYLNIARLQLSLQLTSTFAEAFRPECGEQIIIGQSTDRVLEILL